MQTMRMLKLVSRQVAAIVMLVSVDTAFSTFDATRALADAGVESASVTPDTQAPRQTPPSQKAPRRPVQPAPPMHTQAHARGSAHPLRCPVAVPGTSVTAIPTGNGAVLIFLAPKRVFELRQRARALAAAQNRGALTPPENAPLTRVARIQPHEPLAVAYAIQGGAMIEFTPSKVDQVSDVRTRVLDYARRMSRGECPQLGVPNQVLRTETPDSATPAQIQAVPTGIIPGVGGLSAPGIIIPSLP